MIELNKTYRLLTNPKKCSKLCKEVCSNCKIDTHTGTWTGREFDGMNGIKLYEFKYLDKNNKESHYVFTSEEIHHTP
jgi:hypothetical protein